MDAYSQSGILYRNAMTSPQPPTAAWVSLEMELGGGKAGPRRLHGNDAIFTEPRIRKAKEHTVKQAHLSNKTTPYNSTSLPFTEWLFRSRRWPGVGGRTGKVGGAAAFSR